MTFKLLFNDPDKRQNANKLQLKLFALTNKYHKSCELPKVNTNHRIRQETRFSPMRRLELTLNGVSKVSKIVLTRHVGASLLNECVFLLLLVIFFLYGSERRWCCPILAKKQENDQFETLELRDRQVHQSRVYRSRIPLKKDDRPWRLVVA